MNKATITIAIDLDSGTVDVSNPSATGNVSNSNKAEAKSNEETCVILSKYCLYRLADAGLLESLVAVEYSNKLKHNVWRFIKSKDVVEVFDKYVAERRTEKQDEYKKRMAKEKEKKENTVNE